MRNSVKIIVVESEGYKDIVMYNDDGRIPSTETDIKVNNTPYGYSIILPSHVFERIDFSKYIAEILKLFLKNIPNTCFNFTLDYYYESDEEDYFDIETAKKVLGTNFFLGKINDAKKIKEFNYVQSTESMAQISSYITHIEAGGNDDDEDDEDDEDYDEIDPFKFIMGGEDHKPRRKKKRDKRRYEYDIPKSRSLKNAHRARRSFDRHGVLVADSKSDIRKDEKVIKDFLKEFIPGRGWKKDFREDVLERWVSSFVISKKQLSRLQKKHRKTKQRRKSKVGSAIAKTLSRSADVWYNPNR